MGKSGNMYINIKKATKTGHSMMTKANGSSHLFAYKG